MARDAKNPRKETNYHIEIFEMWYAADRSVRKILPEIQKNGKPHEDTVYNWINRFGWHTRADERDREIQFLLNKEAARRRANMLKRHLEAGDLLLSRGLERLSKNEIKKDADAIAAIEKGVKIGQVSEELPSEINKIVGNSVVVYIPENNRDKQNDGSGSNKAPA